MRNFKSALALMLAVCMVFSNTTFSALAAQNETAAVEIVETKAADSFAEASDEAVLESDEAVNEASEDENQAVIDEYSEDTGMSTLADDGIATYADQPSAPANGTTVGNPFIKGTADSNSFRIPAMVSLSDGTLVAAADARWNSTYDGGGADTIVSVSKDNGQNWAYSFANYLGDNGNVYNGSASTDFVDPALAVAPDDTVYMLVDLYPYGIALNGSGNTQPSTATGFNSDGTLKLSADGSSYNYYLKDGKIYSNSGSAVSGYTVDGYFNVYSNGSYVSNLFFSDSPYKVVRTGYLYLTKSTDQGASWSEPLLIPNVKTTSEMVCLVGPGNGTVLSDGTIVFSVYSYNGSSDTQKTGFIYSSDGGKTWNRSNSNISWSSESSIVEVNASSLRVFYRNGNSKICYADVTKNGNNYTWGSSVTTNVACNSNTQLCAIKVTESGTDYILVSNPGNASNQSGASYRTNGQIVTFKAADMSVVKTTSVPSVNSTNSFMYSCMAQLSNSDIAILYEDKESSWGAGTNSYYQMSFKTFTLTDLGIETKDTEEPGEPTEEDNKADVTVELSVGERSETYTVSSDTNYGSASVITEDGVASYVQTGTAAVAGVTYTKATPTCNNVISSNSTYSWKSTQYYYTPDGSNYYPLYAKRSSAWSWGSTTYTYTWGYSTTSSSDNVSQITTQSTTSTSTTINTTVYTKSGSGTATPASTTIQFTGVTPGTTYVTVGNVTYKVVVAAITAAETKTVFTGKSITLNPSVPDGGSVTYSITGGKSYITLSGATVTAGNTKGSATVVASVKTADGSEYATYTYTINVTDIESYNETLTLAQYGDQEISVTLAEGQTVVWTSEDPSVAGVGKVYNGDTATNKATVLGNKAGNTTITGTVKDESGTVVAVYTWDTTVTAASDTNATSRYIYVNVTQIENCTVYYAINGGELIKIEDTGVLIDEQKNGHFNIMFFADPDDGYALTYMCVTGSAKQYYVLSNGNADGTGSDAWPFNSDTQTTIPSTSSDSQWKSGHGFRWSLLEGNMTINRMKAMFAQAIALGCDGVTNFTKNSTANFYTEVQFVAQPLPTVTKEITSITSNGVTTTYAEGTKIELGDTINYNVTVTKPAYTTGQVWDEKSYTSTSSITESNKPTYTSGNYGTITYSNETLNDPLTQNNGISNPAMGTSGASAATYSYTTKLTVNTDNYDTVVKNGVITNTVNLDYEYKSQYSTGKNRAKADAIAEAEVNVPEYVIDFGLPLEISVSESILGNATIQSGTASYGSVTANGSSFIYTPTTTLKGRDSVVLKLTNGKSYGVNIYPATTVYYEEGFASVSGFTAGSKGTGYQNTQVAGAAGEADEYGYDRAYADNAAQSSGTSAVSSKNGDYMTFSFTGRGIDVYANSSQTTGVANVFLFKVEADGSQTIKKLAAVDTKSLSSIYGISNTQEYDLPIVSINGLEYGNYIVKIIAKEKVDIDGFRVYETMDAEPDFYVSDYEDAPVFVELRDQVLTTATVDTDVVVDDSEESAPEYKQVFEDLSGDNALESAALILDGNNQISAAALLNDGPKNELFLAPNQSVTFTLTTNRKVEVGLKAVNGSTTCNIYNGNVQMAAGRTIDSTTDMFYAAANKRTDGEAAQTITIYNTGDNYLSVTKVKICDDPNAGFGTLTEQDIKDAFAAMDLIDGDDVTETEPAEKVLLDNKITASDLTKEYSTSKKTYSIHAKVSGGAKLTYSSDNSKIKVSKSGVITVPAKFVGKATITIKSAETDTYKAAVKKITLTVLPKTTSLVSVKNTSGKKLVIKWKKNSAVTGYQIQYSTSKNFKSGVKTLAISKNSTVSKTIKSLKKGKTYYVQIRTYKKVGSKKFFSKWSSKKSVKITK